MCRTRDGWACHFLGFYGHNLARWQATGSYAGRGAQLIAALMPRCRRSTDEPRASADPTSQQALSTQRIDDDDDDDGQRSRR